MTTALLSRRAVLRHGVQAGAMLALAPVLLRSALASVPTATEATRTLSLHNLHTGERAALTYWENGVYIPGALAEFNVLLRDHRTGDVHAMDPRLFDVLHRLHTNLHSRAAIEVISGYRSPKTNALLHANSDGVASKSLHMQGKAMDIRVSDRPLAQVHQMALAMQCGGVGYYPASDFVHVDTGRVRKW